MYDAKNVYYVDHVVKGWKYPITVKVNPEQTRFIAHKKFLFENEDNYKIELTDRKDKFLCGDESSSSDAEMLEDEIVEISYDDMDGAKANGEMREVAPFVKEYTWK